MVCIHCGSATQVINSRPQRRSNQVWRRRQCIKCRAVFTTTETTQYDAAWVVRGKAGTLLQPFSRDKLFLSLYESCRHRQTAEGDASALTETVMKKLSAQVVDGVIDSRTVARIAQVALNRFDKAASVHYQVFHA
jgi:transcriptional repressor NrdR